MPDLAVSLAPTVLVPGPRTAAPAADRLAAAAGTSPGLDRLVGLAARLLSSPSAQVSLVSGVQVVAAGHGVGGGAHDAASIVSESLCSVTVATGEPVVLADTRNDPRVRALPITPGAVGSYLGVPLGTADGQVVGALCVFGHDPRAWRDEDVTLLQELAVAVMAELELAALSSDYATSRLRWDTALDAAGIGSFDWDLSGDRVDWDERLQALFGYAPGEYVPHLSEAFRRIHPDDHPAVDQAIAEAVAVCGSYRAEFRVVLPGGRVRWVAARGRATGDVDGVAARLLGTCHDVTEVRTARDEAAQLLETMATGFLSVDRSWRVTYLNHAGTRVVGLSATELVGRDLWASFPGLAESEFGQQYRRAVLTGEPVEVESFYEHLQAWFEVRAVPTVDGLDLYFLDITDRIADQVRAEAAVARLELLAAVSTELAASALQSEDAVRRLAELVVPGLGDWSIVTLIHDDGTVREVGSWHVDPDLRDVVRDYAVHRFDGTGPYAPVVTAHTGREPVVLAPGAAERVIAELTSGVARTAMRRLSPESGVVLPLVARGRVLGTLSVCRAAGRPALTPDEMTLAREVAARAGLALDNARLYAQQRGLAEELQLSLLTEPPEPEHAQIAVRYAPAAATASVGGDWFDSFLSADGATTVVIGDVVGHDIRAAASMGQVRGLLRGIAWDSGAPPASVLTRLDAAMEGLQVQTTASAVVARLEQTAAERERGLTRLRWSNAGHPPPMVLDVDGAVTVLSSAAPDLLLGIDPGSGRTDSQVALGRGATVLLYTDGLVERRGEDLDVGLARLQGALAEMGGLELGDLCDELLRRLAATAEDDVALLALRLDAQGPADQHGTVDA